MSRDQWTTLATDTNNGTFVLEVDTSNLALGDLLEIRAYTVTLAAAQRIFRRLCADGLESGAARWVSWQQGDARVVNSLPDTAIISDDADGHSYTLGVWGEDAWRGRHGTSIQ